MFKNIESRLNTLGFEKIEENHYGVMYKRRVEKYGYNQLVHIHKKKSGNHIIQSYVEALNSDGFNDCVGLTYKEMRLFMKKFRQMKRKYRWK